MLPSKLKALNYCSSDESSNNDDAPVKVTKEVLEAKAELQYSHALQYLARDKFDEAEEQLSKLLQSEIISSLVTTLDQKDKSQSLLVHLKYCCLTNLGNLLLKKSRYHEALNHYQEALIMDNTDLNLWYRIGLTHSKLYQTDQAITAFLEGIKCNPNHWPTLDKLITLLYSSNEYVCCLYYISKSLHLDSGYLKGHFIKEIIFKKFPSLIPYFKSYCSDGGLDIKCTELINNDLQQKILDEIQNFKNNDPLLCLKKTSHVENKPTLYAKHFAFKSWSHLGSWLLQIYDHMFENFDHSLLYEPIQCIYDSSSLNPTLNDIFVDKEYNENNLDKPLYKPDVTATKRRRSSPSLGGDQLKLNRRSTRNKSNSKVESSLVKSVWSIMPPHLMITNDDGDKMNMNSIKWSDDSMDTMDLYRLYESDILNDGLTENLLKNNISDEERLTLINEENYFGSDQEKNDLNHFIELNNNKPISELLNSYLVIIANKWSKCWPYNMVQIYVNVFKRVWIHTGKQHIIFINDSDLNSLENDQLKKVKDEILSVLTYGELLCDLYSQLKICQKPLHGSIIGGDFCSLWIGSINDALSTLDLKDDHKMINIRFMWLRALFNLQDKETGLTCDILNMLVEYIDNLDDYEIVLPNLEFFYRINKKILEKLIFTLKRNNMLSTVKALYESKEYTSVVSILKETLKPQRNTFVEIPSYHTMTRYNQYVFMLNSFLKLKNYHELFKWCEPCLYEGILQHRKSLIEDGVLNHKLNQAEFINNVFYAMLEAIKVEGLNVFDNLTQVYKSRLVQSIVNLLSYLIELTPDGNQEINAVSPWLLIYHLLKHEESKSDESFSSQTTSIPQSLSLLFLGHEFLGKKHGCCFEDGILLFLTLFEIQPYLHLDMHTVSLMQQVEQIFHCLYTTLIKPSRHVQDHYSMGLALTWSRANQLFDFYYPSELPSYDGLSKSFTIHSDTEAIFKKIIALIPEEIKPNRLMDSVLAYIRGETDQLPVNDNPLPPHVKDIFYLMADYNFKNKTWSKAIRYYLLDLCNNFDRFDSWAAMALARGSQIETKLNSCESIKSEGDIIRKAHMTGRCYKHSLKISPENTTLLIEYGTFTYSIHSFCSRLLKQETSNMSLQMFGELEEQKEKMLKIARKCFQTANDVWDYTDCDSQDERWMHHYILGKIAEKNDDNSLIFMDHYLKAATFLNSYDAKFPELISYTSPQFYSIEVLEIYYRIHAAALKILEKQDCQFMSRELFVKIKEALDGISNMSLISDNNKKTQKVLHPDLINNKDIVSMDDIDLVVDQTLNDIIQIAIQHETENNTSEVILNKNLYNIDKVGLSQIKKRVHIFEENTNNSNVPIKKPKLSDDSVVQNTTNIRWTLIQRCIAALKDCIKRFPHHYKSYYRLAHFYFRSSFKDYKEFRNLMFGKKGLFVGQKPNNFFHGIWRIPVSEIDRPGSFAYHMSRCIHLLLDFLKETSDHNTLLELAIQLKYTPDREKKYLRDNDREIISKEALFLSVQILRKLQSENAKTNDRSKNELLLIQVYKSYKKVIKYWPQKDNSLSQLLLNIYQNIVGTKADVSIDIITKYCLKLQAKEKEIEYKNSIEHNKNDCSSSLTISKSNYKLDTPPSTSTLSSFEAQKPTNSHQVSHLPQLQNTPEMMSTHIKSMLAQSSLMFPLPVETCSYSYTLQQKLQATKQKLKRSNNKQKTELKRSTNNKSDNDVNNISSINRPKKHLINKTNETKIVKYHKSPNINLTKQSKNNHLEHNKSLEISPSTLNRLANNLNSAVEIKKIPNNPNNLCNKIASLSHNLKTYDKPKLKASTSNVKSSTITTKTTIPSRNLKSVYIDLDSTVEQARLKSTILLNKPLEKKKTASVSLSPTLLLSSCPGLSITPVVNSNDNATRLKKEQSTSVEYRNTPTKSKNFNFEQLKHLGNSVTITKTEKNKKESPALILID